MRQQFKIDFALFDIHFRHLDFHRIHQGKAGTAALAIQGKGFGAVVVIVVCECRDVYQAINIDIIQRDKETKVGDIGNAPGECFANAVAHEFAFEEIHCVARCFVGTAFGHRAMFAFFHHAFCAVAVIVARAALQLVANGAMHQQIGIAANGRGEMRIVFEGKAEMAAIFRNVNCLTHAAQYHDFYLREIGTVSTLRQ